MRSLLILFVLLWASPVAFAQEAKPNPEVEFKAQVETGKTAYKTGDYPSAVKAFSRAYELRPTASLLYNIARAHDAAGQLKEAEGFYDRFIVAPGISQKARADAVSRLKTVRDIQRMKEAEKENGNEKAPERASASTGPSVATWVLGGMGLATIGAGIVTGILSQSKFDDIEALGYPNSVQQSDLDTVTTKRDSGKTLKVSSIVLLGSGSALLIGGILTYFLTTGTDQPATAWRVSPTTDFSKTGFTVSKSW